MFNKNFYPAISVLILVGLVGGILISSTSDGLTVFAQGQRLSSQSQVDVLENGNEYQIYMPLLEKAWGKSIFGIELHRMNSGGGLNLMKDAGAFWIRRNGLLWSDVEPVQGVRNWDVSPVRSLETELINANQAGMEVILIIRSTPEWAREDPELACGRIKSEALQDFADFVKEAVARYSVPPYNVHYWQIWNEPDADPEHVWSEAPFGCWGNPEEDFFGAGYYTDILKVVYPAAKQANPSIKIVVGGLLLNCDPVEDPVNCAMSTYLEGILVNGGKNYFDAVSFHAYDAYVGLGEYANPNWNSSWDTTGPVVTAKGNYLREILNQYGADDKMLFNSEVAIICGSFYYDPEEEEICTSDEFELTKAYYLTKSYAAAIAIGLDANIWYSITGWRYSGLVKSNLEPLPAFYAYQFARSKLGKALFIEIDDTEPTLFVYKFNLAGQEMQLVWSKDEDPHDVPVPAGSEVWDALGNIVPSNGSVIVEENPYYILYP
ncbi:MAG: hypothetical protein IBX69_09340 [Anaerolineales bacterium]|nr:hypothetical protein [Anaerolineales bacterium]